MNSRDLKFLSKTNNNTLETNTLKIIFNVLNDNKNSN